MNRRHFLSALNASAWGAALPAASLSDAESMGSAPPLRRFRLANVTASEMPFKLGVVAIGSTASAVFNIASIGLTMPQRTIAICLDRSSFKTVKADHKILVESGTSSVNDPLEAVLNAKQTLAAVEAAVAELDLVILVIAAGGETEFILTPVLANLLRSRGIATLGVTIIPSTAAKVSAGRSSIYTSDVDLGCVIPATTAWPASVLQLCRSMANAFAVNNPVCIDIDDFRNGIMGRCAFGYGYAIGPNRAAQAARLAVEHSLLGADRLHRASAALIAIECPSANFHLSEAQSITDYIHNRMPIHSRSIWSVTLTKAHYESLKVLVLASGIDAELGIAKDHGPPQPGHRRSAQHLLLAEAQSQSTQPLA